MSSINVRAGGGELTDVFDTEVVPRGTVYTKGGRYYVFAYNFGADTMAAGDVACISTTFVLGNLSTTAATIMDVTDGTTIRPVVGGIALAAVPTTKFGWFWFRGYGTHAITTDGNVAANDLLTVTDGAKIAVREVTAAQVTHCIIGRAWAADSSTTLSSTELGGNGIFAWPLTN
jgi:hypothetical protein